MIYIKTYLTVICFLFSTILLGQHELNPNNSLYIELFGNGEGLLSVNYERKTGKLFNSSNYTRIGYSINENIFDSSLVHLFPLESNIIFGNKKHHLETGIGVTFIKGTSDFSSSIIPNDYKTNFDFRLFMRFGYRLIEIDGLVIRASPLIVFYREKPLINKFNTYWTIGLSFGYAW